MSHTYHLNFEKLDIEIIENEIGQMTDDNTCIINDYVILDSEKFEKNLYHGSVAVTFIVNLYETALNTILGSKLRFAEIEVLQSSFDVKLQLICYLYGVDIKEIKGDNSYSIMNTAKKIRNDITHFKCSVFPEGIWIDLDAVIPMGKTKHPIAKVFTKSFMDQQYRGVVKLLELICKKCGLVLYKDCSIIDGGGRDRAVEYILTQQEYDERDPSRDYDN